MDKIQLTIPLTDEYQKRVSKARENDELRKCRSWIELMNVSGDTAQVELNRNCVILRCSTPKGTVEESCTYDGVLSVTEMRDGILLRLSHKRLLFLTVSEDGQDNLCLMDAVVLLSEHCDCLFCHSCLHLPGVGVLSRMRFALRKKHGTYTGKSIIAVALVALILFTLFMGTVFVTEPIRNWKIDREESEVYTLTFESADPSYRKSTIRSIRLDFQDTQSFFVDGNCATEDLNDELQKLTPGVAVQIVVHPHSKSVVEIVSGGRVLLNFDKAQEKLWNESVAFAVLGLLVYILDIYLIVVMVRRKF